jgi:hypothetical protein
MRKDWLLCLWFGLDHVMIQSRTRRNVFHSVSLKDGCSCEDATLNENPECEHMVYLKKMTELGLLPNERHGNSYFRHPGERGDKVLATDHSGSGGHHATPAAPA